MNIGGCDMDPIAIALTHIESGRSLSFSGTDLDSGTPIKVIIEAAFDGDLPQRCQLIPTLG